MTTTHIDFLRPFMVDPRVLEGNPKGGDVSDLTRKVHDVFDIMRESPEKLRPSDVRKIVYDEKSAVGAKEARFGHFHRTAAINKQLVGELKERLPDLDLPDNLSIPYAAGLVHDLTNAYVKWGDGFDQQEKELPLFFHAKHLGVESVAEAAMHNAYFGILKMIHDGEGFDAVGKYEAWTATLRDPENSYNFGNVMEEFATFLEGKDKMSLITLTLADCLDDPNANNYRVDINNLDQPFSTRTKDLMDRNYTNKLNAGKPATAFGVALVEKGGLERLQSYLTLVDDLLHNRNVEEYKETRLGLWKK